jgi:hypothetical protein
MKKVKQIIVEIDNTNEILDNEYQLGVYQIGI